MIGSKTGLDHTPLSRRHDCQEIDAAIARGDGNMFGFETPAMAPLACKNAVIWLAMRDPIERIISRLYKPKKGSKSSETFLHSIGGEAAVLRALDKTTWFHSTAHTVGTRSTGAKPLAGKPTW